MVRYMGKDDGGGMCGEGEQRNRRRDLKGCPFDGLLYLYLSESAGR